MNLAFGTCIFCLLLNAAASKELPKDSNDVNNERNAHYRASQDDSTADFVNNVGNAHYRASHNLEDYRDNTVNKERNAHYRAPQDPEGKDKNDKNIVEVDIQGNKYQRNEKHDGKAEHIDVTSRYCKVYDHALSCDLEWKQFARLRELTEGHFKKVFIKNVHELAVSQSTCVGLVLENVGKAVVHGPTNSDCPGGKFLVLRNATVNRLPAFISSVYMSNSYIDDVVLETVTDAFVVERSGIGSLDLSSTSTTNVEVLFTHANIKRISKLHIGGSSILHMLNSTIGHAKEGAIILDSGKHLFHNTVANSTSAFFNVLVRGGSELRITDLVGSVNVLSAPSHSGQDAPSPNPQEMLHKSTFNSQEKQKLKNDSVSPCTITEDNSGMSYCKVFVILFTFSVFLNVVQLLFNQPRELVWKILNSLPSASEGSTRKRKNTSCEDDSEVNLDQHSQERKRLISFSVKEDMLPEMEKGDPVSRSSFTSEVNLVDETPPPAYRHSMSIDGTGNFDILKRIHGSSQLPRRRLLSAHT